MRILVIDTATQALSVALFDGNTLVANHHAVVGRGHAEHLLPVIAHLPDNGRADHIAVDVGPGSFTGVRIGLAAARALGFAWNSPVQGYSALAMVAAAARTHEACSGKTITVVLTGGHGELFWQRFDAQTLHPLAPFASTPINTLAGMIEDRVVFGSGAQVLVDARGTGMAVVMHPDATTYPALPKSLADLPPGPLYGRGADATPMAAP